MASPGNNDTHGAVRNKSRPSATIAPQLGDYGRKYTALTIATEARDDWDEAFGQVLVIYASSGSNGPIVYKQAMTSDLTFGDRITLIAFHSTTDVIAPSTEIDAKTRLILKRKLAELAAHRHKGA